MINKFKVSVRDKNDEIEEIIQEDPKHRTSLNLQESLYSDEFGEIIVDERRDTKN